MIHILGSGPAGLLAAWAAERADQEVTIHSIKEPSDIRGAQFLHETIPGLTNRQPDVILNFEKRGTKEGYARKIYGNPKASCSWDAYDGETPGWDMVEMYGTLWTNFETRIKDVEIRFPYIEGLLLQGDTVISTLNPLGYCQAEHEFRWAKVFISETSSISDRNTVVYNGDPEDQWYRSAMIGPHGSTEVAQVGKGLPWEFVERRKPLFTDCDCLGEYGHFHRTGRFGAFKKGVLVHDAYRDAREILR